MARILLIEDEVHVQRIIGLILSERGHIVETASDGQSGLQAINDTAINLPDLVLLDLMMPGISGLQVLQAVKENRRTAPVPVVLLTAIAQESVVLQGVRLGARDYIRKPFHPQDLAKRVERVLAK